MRCRRIYAVRHYSSTAIAVPLPSQGKALKVDLCQTVNYSINLDLFEDIVDKFNNYGIIFENNSQIGGKYGDIQYRAEEAAR